MTARSRHVSVKEFEPKTSWTAFRSGVSLHAHTHHSRETMADIPPSVLKSPVFAPIFAELQAMARASGDPVDFSTGWWHPPVTPRQVFDGEVKQIEDRFGLAPLVSVTDHDDIAANLELQSLYAERCAPISVEWTVPFRRGYFHLGIHNLPSHGAADWFHRLQGSTAGRGDSILEVLLDLDAEPGVLIVFNHPLWDLASVGDDEHQSALAAFLDVAGSCIHALEFNGYRSRKENNAVRRLASDVGLPLLSGGDRHGCAVNAVLNVTATRSFAEFVDEVRTGVSHLVVMPEYRQHLLARMLACAADVVRHQRVCPPDLRRWTDRVSWRSHGSVRPLSFHWPTGGPIRVRSAIRTVQVMASPVVLPILTAALDRLDPEGMGA